MFINEVLNPFLEAVRKHGNCNAFCINDRFHTYNEFGEAVSGIRVLLETRNLEDKNIGLVSNDDLETYASIFALWLEGFAYVPISPGQEMERTLDILSQADVSLVIDSRAGMEYGSLPVINSSDLPAGIFLGEPAEVSDDSLAYILFTSGSTGKPKGVMISRKNVSAFLKSFMETGIKISKKDKCLQSFDLTFDVSVQSFLVPLVNGACIYTIPHDQIKYSYVYGLLEDHQITFGAIAPSMLRYLRPYFDEIFLPGMRYTILTAEASPVDLIAEWSGCIPNAEIYNFYGPTECTIYCTYNKFVKGGNNKHLNGMLSIGNPMNGLNAIVIDKNRNILGKRLRGELCICGDQVTPGYWKNPEKNEVSFFEIDYKGKSTRFYRTGDSCFFDDDGDIMLSGRLDHQVKIHGFRVEPGEIEYHAREYLEGNNAVVCAFNNHIGNTELALYIEANKGDEISLLKYLNSKLPYYMVPTRILYEPVFPLNKNGKVDRIMLVKRLR